MTPLAKTPNAKLNLKKYKQQDFFPSIEFEQLSSFNLLPSYELMTD